MYALAQTSVARVGRTSVLVITIFIVQTLYTHAIHAHALLLLTLTTGATAVVTTAHFVSAIRDTHLFISGVAITGFRVLTVKIFDLIAIRRISRRITISSLGICISKLQAILTRKAPVFESKVPIVRTSGQ